MILKQAPSFSIEQISEHKMAHFAQLLSVVARPGDVIALEGDLGAGKTTFARAFIRSLVESDDEDVPSPTYTLVQTYDSARLRVSHFDLYRISDSSELDEIGLDYALNDGVAIIEWPSKAGDRLAESRLQIHFTEQDGEPIASAALQDTRTLVISGHGEWGLRAARLQAAYELLDKSGWWDDLSEISFLAGDASARSYARLIRNDGRRALLMDWPRKSDTKILRDGKTYNQIAHIADTVVAFVGVSNAVRDHGLSAPEIYGVDIENGLAVLEDLGDRAYFDEVQKGHSMSAMWRAATDTLIALRAVPVEREVEVAQGVLHQLPGFDRDALWAETELLADWYWPHVYGQTMPEAMRNRFSALWDTVIAKLDDEPVVWAMRDYHSPNLVWLPERETPRDVGIIDFQDAVAGPSAYDLVSLLQDARVTVPPALETELLEHYCARVLDGDHTFDRHRFLFSYAALGAQRNTKILGIFARLANRDGKPHYLSHIHRIWGYLARDLEHCELQELASWYDEAFDETLRSADVTSLSRQ